MGKKRIDLTGKKFGKLTVLEYSHTNRFGASQWKCLCECGNYKIVDNKSLRKGATKSCGCASGWLKKDLGVSCFNQVVSRYKMGAKKRSLQYNLSDDVARDLFSQNCYYCGKPPSQIRRSPDSNGEFVYNGIDRLDPSIGYVEYNVVPCCKTCNLAKRTMTYEEFIEWVFRTSEFLKTKEVEYG